jgi:MFS family permease
MGVYFLAIPVGGALGFALGSILGQQVGWRAAFMGVGIPGLFIAFVVLRLPMPVRGINDKSHSSEEDRRSLLSENTKECSSGPWYKDYKTILSNSHFVCGMAGTVCSIFALGGLADWIASFAVRYRCHL